MRPCLTKEPLATRYADAVLCLKCASCAVSMIPRTPIGDIRGWARMLSFFVTLFGRHRSGHVCVTQVLGENSLLCCNICAVSTNQDICVWHQVLGENALLARVLLEGVGAFARALGGRYRASGRLMYTVLIPLLERLADPCPSVSAAAAAAIGSLCVHSGYASFDELVGISPLSAPCLHPLLRLLCL